MSVTTTITLPTITETTLDETVINEGLSTATCTTATITPTIITENNLDRAVNKVITTTSDDEKTMIRSGVTAAVLGILLGGPLLSAFLGFTAAYASQKENDRAGRYARSLGDFGVSAKERAFALDAKCHISRRCAEATERAWCRAKEYDTRYDVLEKLRNVASRVCALLVKYVLDHRLLERGVEVAGRGYEYVANRIGGDGNAKNSTMNTSAATEKVSVVTVTSLPISLLPTVISMWVLFWVNYVRECRLLERGVEAAGQGYQYVASRIRADDKSESEKNASSRSKKKNFMDEMRDVASSLWALLMVAYEYAVNRIGAYNRRAEKTYGRNDIKED
uniref:Uncharacterized protein n=1 Tax=Pseudictyota dubia TaxID=2749911 RepID=A0A7R9ZAN4_9STRA|mmetsp:Transcript_35306/g.64908  ORF Transcript_35306/g.64908 Transcript_35306/m.64908 type:complete len:335 (+) Transcript_35306:55-1059(+)|eukprot:CAMPEP_0197452264 /NCGR_PEP_ID=MMETSP1175-20131217/31634_1 /TAXON_ID=1003142 /ORGANISM="Triceratium dubium, Strain CCMP147" /LENGTH=334 /DNA_ID=CAMNT_0042985231 /DNA_START=55 /DNA_END=1059 /DNA_ORIENTATION=+